MDLGKLAFDLQRTKQADNPYAANPSGAGIAGRSPGYTATPGSTVAATQAQPSPPSFLGRLGNIAKDTAGIGSGVVAPMARSMAAAPRSGWGGMLTPWRGLFGRMGMSEAAQGAIGGVADVVSKATGLAATGARTGIGSAIGLGRDLYRGGLAHPLQGIADNARDMNQQDAAGLENGQDPLALGAGMGNAGRFIDFFSPKGFDAWHPYTQLAHYAAGMNRVDPDFKKGPLGSSKAITAPDNSQAFAGKMNAGQPKDDFEWHVDSSGRRMLAYKPTNTLFNPTQGAFGPPQIDEQNAQDTHVALPGMSHVDPSIVQRINQSLATQRPDLFEQMYGDPTYLAQQANGNATTPEAQQSHIAAIRNSLANAGIKM